MVGESEVDSECDSAMFFLNLKERVVLLPFRGVFNLLLKYLSKPRRL